MRRFLLHTNIIGAITRPAPSASLIRWMSEQSGDDLFIASLTVAEIRRGACTGRRSTTLSAETKPKPFPVFRSDEDAERFVEQVDLTDYDLTGFEPMAFEFQPKTARVNMRLPGRLLAAVKEAADAAGVPYQRFIRQALESAVQRRR